MEKGVESPPSIIALALRKDKSQIRPKKAIQQNKKESLLGIELKPSRSSESFVPSLPMRWHLLGDRPAEASSAQTLHGDSRWRALLRQKLLTVWPMTLSSRSIKTIMENMQGINRGSRLGF
jgi:hypothetical protein